MIPAGVKAVRRPQTRAAWLEARRAYIGASDIATILGLSPWRTAAGLWLERTGRAEAAPASIAMEIGVALEPVAAQLYARETGRTVRNFGYMLIDEAAHICADVDRLICRPGMRIAAHGPDIRAAGILECKTGAAWGDEIPAHYAVQLQAYMGLSALPFADIAAIWLAPRREFRNFRAEADAGIWSAIRERVRAWHERHIGGDTPPEPACEDDCRKLWQAAHGSAVTAGEAEIRALDALRAAEREIDTLDASAARKRAEIMAAMRDADALIDPDTGRALATWRQGKPRAVIDWDGVRNDLAGIIPAETVAAIIAAHTTTRPGTRVFRLAKTENNEARNER